MSAERWSKALAPLTLVLAGGSWVAIGATHASWIRTPITLLTVLCALAFAAAARAADRERTS